MKRLAWLVLCCFASNAYSNDEVSITLVGHISPVCEFTSQNNNLEFSSSGVANTTLEINCNSPMRISMQSLNGGLSHEQSSRVSSYNINWSLEGANKSVSVSAQATKSTYSFNINDILFDSIAEIQLTLDEPLIYAGSYQDVIRIEMTPSVVSGGVL
ncbi:hypothetical protein [uncultured Pseudoalteromonas sp.]|uniref:hypothetical protein n=1 Tax=uncultured Pseudoalteromonas sp. TaxID=114053 RepID=UPI0025923A42|nr:hypothetical protein [uncultured Pseudoalteromonas sp.]